MANATPLEVPVLGTDVEDLEFTLEWELDDGAFPWADYTYAYAVTSGGGNVFELSEGDGITVDPTAGTISFFKAAGALCPGTYAHGCLLTHTATGKKVQAFLGAVTIAEGAPR
jgi:hypothetical protein